MIKKLQDTAAKMVIKKAGKQTKKTTIKSTMYWWLSQKRPFIVNDEYAISLICLDRKAGTAKILITNLKTNETAEASVPEDGNGDVPDDSSTEQ